MANQLLVADQHLGFARAYLPEPVGEVGRAIVKEAPVDQDLFVGPDQDMTIVKMVEIAFSLARHKVDRNEALVWKYEGDLFVDAWLDKTPAKLAATLKDACGAVDLEVHAVGSDRATVSAYFGKGERG